MSRRFALVLLLIGVATNAFATGQLYVSVDLSFDFRSGQAWAYSVSHADYEFAAWYEPVPYVGGTHSIDNTNAFAEGGSPDGSWSNFVQGYAIFGVCDYRGRVDAWESNNWTTQGAGTASQCCPMPDCELRVSHLDGGYTTPLHLTVECGEVVTVTAYPYPSYEFSCWEGMIASTDNPIDVQVTARPTYLTAVFHETCDPSTNPNCICTPWTNPKCPCDRTRDPNCCDPSDPSCQDEPPVIPNPDNSPIVLNLGAGPYRLTGVVSPVSFDVNASGTPVRIGWTASDADEAFLSLDRNGNGTIDNGGELFGTATRLKSGKRAENGFAALAEFDDNRDEFIDEKDAIWAGLLLWRDENHDGVSQPSELMPVSGSVLKAIRLDYHWSGRHDVWGNTFRYEALAWISSNGQNAAARPVYDIFFVRVP